MRYAPLLSERGATVLVQAYPALVKLLAAMPGLHQVVSTDDPLPEADIHTMVISLPLAFETTPDTVPSAGPYLRVPADRRALWAEALGVKRKPRIGLAWSGSSHSLERSAILAALLADLMQRPGLEFHSLQRDITDSDAAWLRDAQPPLSLHQDRLLDFADTAALIEQMDLVITIDTAVAHLAGALARPVWVMLPFNPDFRWLLHRTDCPWYPTARLFRQPAPGAWTEVVQTVTRALAGERLGSG